MAKAKSFLLRALEGYSNNDKEIVIFGESHNNRKSVDSIREEVVSMKPDVILHELYWFNEDLSYYKDELPDTPVIPLEDDVSELDNKAKLKDQFEVRENSMLRRLNEAVKEYDRIAVVVGDTHLRTIKTRELGRVSPIHEWAREHDATIVRSEYGEIQ